VSTLRQSVAEYLAVRRALGYKLEQTERFLGQFMDYLDANGVDRITVKGCGCVGDVAGARAPLARDAARRGPWVRALPARS
jgi:hypothetical protein